MKNTVKCIHCGKEIEISEAILSEHLETIKQNIKKEYSEKQSVEVRDLKKQIEEQKKKNDEFREKELLLREEKRKIEEEKRELKLEVQRTLDEERKKIEEKILKGEGEKHRLEKLEWEKQKADMQKAIEEAQRKGKQGSQQTQGEAFELEFEDILRREFPNDIVEDVAKGIRGGDIIQEVVDRNGNNVGKILWELKNTKRWEEGWIDTLKSNQRMIKAEDAVLITEALPNDMKSSGAFRNGVWVTHRDAVIGIASVLRAKLIQLFYAKSSAKGKNEKMEILYSYLSGTEFKHRVEAIIEAWTSMQEDIEKEKRYFSHKWARDDKNIRQVIDNTIGMRGDMQGILGNSLPQIKGLETVFELEEKLSKNTS